MKTNYKSNLLIGFGASLLILLVTSVASYVSIQNLLSSAYLVDHTFRVKIATDEVFTAIKDAEAGQRGYLLTNDPAYLEHYRGARQVVSGLINKVQELTLDNDDQQRATEKLRGLVDERFDVMLKVIQIKQSTGEISIETLDDGKMQMDVIRDVITEMKETEQNHLIDRTKRMNVFAQFTPILIILAALAAVIVTTLFYARTNNDFHQRLRLQQELQRKDIEISGRIAIIQSLADKIALGNYAVRIDDQQSDALGSVAGSLNKMAASLKNSFDLLSDKEWLQSGIAKLNDVMIGEKNVDYLGEEIINFLSQYINSHAGALYLYENEQLHFTAGYAYIADSSRQRVKMGDGLVGQSLESGKLKELRDIPSETIYIKFTTGEATPRHVLALPVYDGRTPKGAIEVASLSGFSERDIEFLQSSAHNIGVAINTAQNRKKLQELLEETQSQSEELQTQHSELENINSELEVQSEKLQASEEELKVQQEELRQANQELEERSRLLEERNQLISMHNQEIQFKARELAQSARYKSEFLANMSHELRTPLNSILLLSRLMTENPESNLSVEQVEFARVIQSSGIGLLSLIDEILDLSKIESGKMDLDYGVVSLQELVGDMRALFNPLAQEKNIEFRTHIDPDAPQEIETDKMRLEQIIRNLLSNAIKFTGRGYVSMTIARNAKQRLLLNIVVKDTGIGIPSDKQQLVFEAFQQADGSTRRKYGGTGLGLSISRELIKLLGGEILITSEVDQGSEFTVCLPIDRAAREHVTSETLEQETSFDLIEEKPGDDSVNKYLTDIIPEGIEDDRESITRDDKVILIVEDDTGFAKSLLEYTRRRGYKGLVAVRGDEGIVLAKKFSPLGILLDIQLPVKSGWQVMEELKSDNQTRHIPVHIMSSYEVRHESLRKGAVDFINKPIAFERMQDIFKKIEYVLTQHPKKVLIVEENPQHAKALAYFLETFDMSLEIRNRIDGAIDSLRKDSVDCVILDMGIPDQKSYDMLEDIKKTPGLENLPIIVFTGRSLSTKDEARIKQYADSIIVKTAHSYKRMLDEVSLFLHLMEKNETASSSPAKGKYNKLGALDDVLQNKTVLIVDDDVRNIFSLTRAMERFKLNVITAVDGKEALVQLRDNPHVDIVLMDMMMPEMDGYETTMQIRKNPALKNMPVIAVTAKAMVGDREKCINAGASDYITKPVDFDQLLSLLRVWLYEKNSRK